MKAAVTRGAYMKKSYDHQKIPKSRIATFDVFSVGLLRHHVSALLEFDVTLARKKLRAFRKEGVKASFTAWMISAVCNAISRHPAVSAYKVNDRTLAVSDDISVSVVVEKEIDGEKVPMPMVIRDVLAKSISDITLEIENAKNQPLSPDDIVLNEKTKRYERLYYLLPGPLRRAFWRFMLRHPEMAHKNMGNVSITSLGMVGKIKGWFIHRSVHPISFGIGSIVKKPAVAGNEIKIREILNMTILIDHDVTDGAPMVRFLNDLTENIESGYGL